VSKQLKTSNVNGRLYFEKQAGYSEFAVTLRFKCCRVYAKKKEQLSIHLVTKLVPQPQLIPWQRACIAAAHSKLSRYRTMLQHEGVASCLIFALKSISTIGCQVWYC